MAAIFFARMLIKAVNQMTVVKHLEISMGFNAPATLFPNKGFQNGGRIFVMVVGGKDISNVVQQSRYNPIDISAVSPGPRRGLC